MLPLLCAYVTFSLGCVDSTSSCSQQAGLCDVDEWFRSKCPFTCGSCQAAPVVPASCQLTRKLDGFPIEFRGFTYVMAPHGMNEGRPAVRRTRTGDAWWFETPLPIDDRQDSFSRWVVFDIHESSNCQPPHRRCAALFRWPRPRQEWEREIASECALDIRDIAGLESLLVAVEKNFTAEEFGFATQTLSYVCMDPQVNCM